MRTCNKCGKRVKHQFALCWACYEAAEDDRRFRQYDAMTPQEREDQREAYYNRECVMCGKEGAITRKDDKNYCDTCWQVWTG